MSADSNVLTNAQRSVAYPDWIAPRIEELGLQRQLYELADNGYWILENAASAELNERVRSAIIRTADVTVGVTCLVSSDRVGKRCSPTKPVLQSMAAHGSAPQGPSSASADDGGPVGDQLFDQVGVFGAHSVGGIGVMCQRLAPF